VIPQGNIVRHLGAPLGVLVENRYKIKWVWDKIAKKMMKWGMFDMHQWGRLKILKFVFSSYVLFFVPLLDIKKIHWNDFLKPLRIFL